MSTSQSPPRKRIRSEDQEELNPPSTDNRNIPSTSSGPNLSNTFPSTLNPCLSSTSKSTMMTHDDNITASGDVVPAANNHNRPSRSIEARKNRLSKGNKGVSIKDHGSRNHRTNSSSNGIKQDPDDGDNSSSGSEFDGGGDGTSMDTNSHDSFSSSLLRKVRKVNGLSKADQEIVRLVGQHLTNIGLKSSAAVLMAEAGCRLDQPTAATFRKFVMNGEWSSAVNSKYKLSSLNFAMREYADSTVRHILTYINIFSALEELKAHLENPDNFVEMKFLLLEQKYLELLYRGNSIEALKVSNY